nr:MAG TPA: hypothetical protein [Caudoviricetes sp.]
MSRLERLIYMKKKIKQEPTSSANEVSEEK